MKNEEHCTLCDCAQGRWPCTCMPRYAGKRPELGMPYEDVPEAIRLDAHKLLADGVDAYLSGAAGAPDPYKVAAEAIKSQPGYWQEKAKLLLAAHFEKCAEFDALNARLRVYQGVAVIGWAGFILTLLGV